MPRFTIGAKQSGETLKLGSSASAKLEVELNWTFPMAFAGIVTGDGKEVYRQRFDLAETGAFGKKTLGKELNLKEEVLGSLRCMGHSHQQGDLTTLVVAV